jgi:hypothetical protein
VRPNVVRSGFRDNELHCGGRVEISNVAVVHSKTCNDGCFEISRDFESLASVCYILCDFGAVSGNLRPF